MSKRRFHPTGCRRSWMLSQEFQIMEGHTGDFWSQATSAMDIKANKPAFNLDPMDWKSNPQGEKIAAAKSLA